MRLSRLITLATSVIGATSIAFLMVGSAAAQGPVTIQMIARNGTGQSGTATLTPVGNNQVRVVLNLTNSPAGPQPAHIHTGSCPDVGAVEFPLTNVTNGRSETTVNTTMDHLMSEAHGINVHKSPAEVSFYTSCGDIPLATAASGGKATPAQAGKAAPAQAPAQVPAKAAPAPTGKGAPAQAPAPARALPRTGSPALPIAGLAVLGLISLGVGVVTRRRAA